MMQKWNRQHEKNVFFLLLFIANLCIIAQKAILRKLMAENKLQPFNTAHESMD